jgi:hypothetical protein
MFYLVIQSNYNYRNVPLFVFKYGAVTAEDLEAYARDGIRVKHAKPGLIVRPGEPVFKTQRLLGARALVTDSFSSPRGYYNPIAQMGMAGYAHRDGYNVLYGDASARWYGDAQQRIMWYDVKQTSAGGRYGTYMNSLQHNCIGAWTYPDGSTGRNNMSSVQVWHIYDTNNGVDVGVDE